MRFFRPIGDLKGWQRFGFEVAIIVFGLGITLIAQNDQRFIRFTSGDVDLAGFIANDIAVYGASCVDTTQYQPFIDELNATTGMNFRLAPRSVAP